MFYGMQSATPDAIVIIQLKTEEEKPSHRSPLTSSTSSRASPRRLDIMKFEGISPIVRINCPANTRIRFLGSSRQITTPRKDNANPLIMALSLPNLLLPCLSLINTTLVCFLQIDYNMRKKPFPPSIFQYLLR